MTFLTKNNLVQVVNAIFLRHCPFGLAQGMSKQQFKSFETKNCVNFHKSLKIWSDLPTLVPYTTKLFIKIADFK